MRLSRLVLLVAALAFAACSASDGEKAQDPGKKVGKGDCPDCDPHGGSAFEQADMGLRFYVTGDTWQVAWQFKVRHDMARETLHADQLPDDPGELPAIQEERQVSLSPVYLFGYAVGQVDKQVIDNVQREVAVIRVTQAPAARADLFSQERLDRHEYALEFALDDLLRPMWETFYNQEYPNGKYIEVDSESSLSGLDSGAGLFPHNVPRVLTQGLDSAAPSMTFELEAAADAMVPGWRQATYRKFQFANGDVVYWAAGALWPFFVDCQTGYGLLVGQTLAER
ncbi:MAG: hypothetical protein FJ109_04360 [Deltaproteobacteria bacterium]|nr:hypothetical protein [Deltaproteobacteria bacterium]